MLGVVMPPTLLALADESRRFESETSGFGTLETCRSPLRMSANRGAPEVFGRSPIDAIDPGCV